MPPMQPQGCTPRASRRRLIQRLIGLLAPAVAFFGAAAWFQPDVPGSDLWWHLATGRDIVRLGMVPLTDIYSYTFAGKEWMNPYWLWDLLYWCLYDLHPQVIAWFNLAVVSASFGLTYTLARRQSGSDLGAGAAVWLAAASAHWFLDIRPHLFTLLFLNVFLVNRDRPWAPWFWPVLVALWVNIHGGFVFGIGAIGLYVTVRTLDERLREERWVVPWRLWVGVGFCLVAMGANPHGYLMLEYPAGVLDPDSAFRSLVEWRPPELSLDLRSYGGRFCLTVMLAAVGVLPRARRDPYLLVLNLVVFLMALSARRFIPLFAITAAPLVASGVAYGKEALGRRVHAVNTLSASVAMILATAVITGLLWQEVRLHPKLLERWTKADLFPEAALRYLVALGSPERLFCHYTWAGYVMLHAPQMKVAIDGRASTVYDGEIFRDYASIERGDAGLHHRFARYGADAALLRAGTAPVKALTQSPSSWQLVYMDGQAAILLPPDSPFLTRLPDWEDVLEGHPERYYIHAEVARRQGSLDPAIANLERALELNPLSEHVYGKLADVYFQRGDLDAVARVIERGIQANPRRAERLRYHEGLIYQRAGDYRRALRAYKQAVPRGPFILPEGVERVIALLEKKIAERGDAT